VRRLYDFVLFPTPAQMRRIALAGLVWASLIIVSGAAVRLSQSGLGCTTWPQCTSHSLVAAGTTGDPLIHRWIEFGNRLVTIAFTIVSVVVAIAAWRYRDGISERRRRDVSWLGLGLPLGVVADAVIGGIVVLTKLDPIWVSIHFLASMALVAVALALYVRCAEGPGPATPLVRREVTWLARALVTALTLMITVGTVVTGSGPLAGAPSVARYGLPRAGVTQFHADIGWLVGGLLIALVLTLRLTPAPQRSKRLGYLLLGLVIAQGCIGYSQYFLGLPAGLVWVHVTGALLIWITVLSLTFTLRDRGRAVGRGAPPADGTAAAQTLPDDTAPAAGEPAAAQPPVAAGVADLPAR